MFLFIIIKFLTAIFLFFINGCVYVKLCLQTLANRDKIDWWVRLPGELYNSHTPLDNFDSYTKETSSIINTSRHGCSPVYLWLKELSDLKIYGDFWGADYILRTGCYCGHGNVRVASNLMIIMTVIDFIIRHIKVTLRLPSRETIWIISISTVWFELNITCLFKDELGV